MSSHRTTVPASLPRGSSARLMIAQDPARTGSARVIGSLTADTVQLLLDAVDGGVTVLDLAEVAEVDDSAVRVLIGLRERCTLSACPRWLELWLDRAQQRST